MHDSSNRSADAGRWALQAAFVAWLIAVNVLYYAQFKAMFLARFSWLVKR